MKIIVNDTNIFIDLHSVGLLEELCRLPYDIHTVDFVVAEIEDAEQREIFDKLVDENRIIVDGFNARLPKSEIRDRLKRWREVRD